MLGKPFGPHGLSLVRAELGADPGACRAELARRVCQRLNWRSPGGAYQFMSARVGLLRLARAGWIQLPAPRNGNGNGQPRPRAGFAQAPPAPVHLRADWPADLLLQRVDGKTAASKTFNELIEQNHYLGYTPMAGAQVRYLIGGPTGWLGAISFGAGAWAVAARDRYIGWSAAARQARLHLVLNNSRLLLAPGVRSPNLAARVLSRCARRLPADFRELYGYAPVLLETFVELARFGGGCYRAANWQCVGHTQGRGKKGSRDGPGVPRKAVWVYPLHPRFRAVLRGEAPWR